jgi:hypothetical protein
MDNLSYTFSNSGDSLLNDVVYPDKALDLNNNSYSFLITPKTNFWRFGIRFGKTESANFSSNQGRYNDEEVKHIEVAAGVRSDDEGKWSQPNFLFLQEYFVKVSGKGSVINGWQYYSPLSVINLEMKYDSKKGSLVISCWAENCQLYSTELSIPGYNFFKMAAWADKIDFEVDCQVKIVEQKAWDTTKLYSKANILFKDRASIDAVLGVKDIADELSQIIKKMPYEQGRMIGLFGKWGRGKTFLMDELWNFLASDRKKIIFHAWLYQDTPAIWAYLYEQFAKGFYESSSGWWQKIKRRFHLNIIRLGAYEIIWFAAFFILSLDLSFWVSPQEKLNAILRVIGCISLSTLIGLLLIYLRFGNQAISLFKKYYSKISFTDRLGMQAEVQKELKHLVQAWDQEILLFVDDIDRCPESKILQIVDSLRVMLDDPDISKRVIVVVALDERILRYAIRLKYSDLIKSDHQDFKTIETLVTEYIDKLFLFGIKLGDLTGKERLEFFDELTKEDRPKNLVVHINEEIQISSKQGGKNAAVTSKTTEMRKVTQEEERKLQPDEVETLKDLIEKYEDATTPRQVRVFYYRYLVAKNLLIRQYSLLGKDNIWIRPSHNGIFISLLVRYSSTKNSHLISQHKQDAYKSLNSKMSPHLLEQGVVLESDDYFQLLRVLDIVIAY